MRSRTWLLGWLTAGVLAACEVIPMQVVFAPTGVGPDAALGLVDAGGSDAPDAALGPADAGGSEAPDAAAPLASGFEAAWTTPNTVRWRWSWTGDLSQVERMEVAVAGSASEAEQRTGNVKVWTRIERPELGGGFLSGASDPVVSTTTSGLVPGTSYWAVLTVFTRGEPHPRASAPAAATTRTEPVHELVVFRDDAPAGYRLPDSFVRGAHAFAGTASFDWVPGCPASGGCWENLRFKDLALSTSAVPEAAFVDGSAFLELAVENCGAPGMWSEVRAWPGSCQSSVPAIRALTLTGGCGYQILQLPLRDFEAMTFARFSEGLCEVGVGSSWTQGQRVSIDEVRVRW